MKLLIFWGNGKNAYSLFSLFSLLLLVLVVVVIVVVVFTIKNVFDSCGFYDNMLHTVFPLDVLLKSGSINMVFYFLIRFCLYYLKKQFTPSCIYFL